MIAFKCYARLAVASDSVHTLDGQRCWLLFQSPVRSHIRWQIGRFLWPLIWSACWSHDHTIWWNLHTYSTWSLTIICMITAILFVRSKFACIRSSMGALSYYVGIPELSNISIRLCCLRRFCGQRLSVTEKIIAHTHTYFRNRFQSNKDSLFPSTIWINQALMVLMRHNLYWCGQLKYKFVMAVLQFSSSAVIWCWNHYLPCMNCSHSVCVISITPICLDIYYVRDIWCFTYLKSKYQRYYIILYILKIEAYISK